MMDFSNNGRITLTNFKMYINLIIGAVRKVNPSMKYDPLNEEDISILFQKIAKKKNYFTHQDFEIIYHEKPELISWIDYFKNDTNDLLLVVHVYLKKITALLCSFSKQMVEGIHSFRKGEKFDLESSLREKINIFDKKVAHYEKKIQSFIEYNQFNMRNIIDNYCLENRDDDSFSDSEVDDEEDETTITKRKSFDNLNPRQIVQKKNEIIIKDFFERIRKRIKECNMENEAKPRKVKDLEEKIIFTSQESNKDKDSSSDCEISDNENLSDFVDNMNSLKRKKSRILSISATKRGSSVSQINFEAKNDKNVISNKLLRSFERVFLKFFKIFVNSNQCYQWIGKHFLKAPLLNLLKMKKEEKKLKKTSKEKLKEEEFSISNIPKTKLKTSEYSFKILLNMIMGIQIAVEATPNITSIHKISQFLHSLTYSIQTINFGVEKQETFLLKEYAGIIFNNIRKIFGFDKDKFIASISPQDFITNMIISSSASIEELCTTGRSGSLFYYTRDGKFILKTISKEEYKTLKRILPTYYEHLIKYPQSLLPKFFGCYKLIKKVKKNYTFVYFIIMMNIFSTNNEIHLRFDLKGSQICREVLNDDNIKDINELYGKYSFALKDCDLNKYNKTFTINREVKDKILKQLYEDSIFLRDCNLNDYSLLVGIHKTDILTDNSSNIDQTEIEMVSVKEKDKMTMMSEADDLKSFDDQRCETNQLQEVDILPDGGIINEKKDEIFYIGIIDILTNFNCLKRMEYCLKAIRYCSKQMSCTPPTDYQERFYRYLSSKFDSKEDKENSVSSERSSEK